MTPFRSAFVVAGPASGVGKTTVALGVMAALSRRGLTVQPFKCGPDFIDTGHHSRVCGCPSRNLDGWMLSDDVNRALFYRHAETADIAILEGVMGLFDGARDSGAGSTAAMAKLLGLPVLLVVDASHMAGSVAALVQGFEHFDPDVKIAGVVLNKVGSSGHYRLLSEALARAGCAPAVGYLPREAELHIAERHLGLYTADEGALSTAAVGRLSSLVEQSIELDRILAMCATERASLASAGTASRQTVARIAVARDRAFCFYYEDNLDVLRAAGAEIVEFSPLMDRTLPDGTDAIYIGGGYPELYAAELSDNHEMRAALWRFVKSGGPVYAECGGLMYLGRHLRQLDGEVLSMVGILPFGTRMTNRLMRFGYADVTLTTDCLLGRAGESARGHSFHYSTLDGDPDVACAYRVQATLSGVEHAEGYVVESLLASYVHLHFLSNPRIGKRIVETAHHYKAQRGQRRADLRI